MCRRFSAIIGQALAILAGAQCKKHGSDGPDNPYGLPNVDEPGTMGALINGRPWIASAAALASYQTAAYTYGDSIFTVGEPHTGSVWTIAVFNPETTS
jgi:hypothetical protein